MSRQNKANLSNVVTSTQAADLMGVSLRWFFTLIERGAVPKHITNIGKSLLWDKEAIKKAKRNLSKKPNREKLCLKKPSATTP